MPFFFRQFVPANRLFSVLKTRICRPVAMIFTSLSGPRSLKPMGRSDAKDFLPIWTRSGVVLRIAACENTGDVVQHVGGAGLVIAEVLDQALFDHVDLGLRLVIDNA